MSDEIYTVAQAAEYLKVSEKTVRRMIKAKSLVASQVSNRSWRIRKSDIDTYLIEHTNGKEGATNHE